MINNLRDNGDECSFESKICLSNHLALSFLFVFLIFYFLDCLTFLCVWNFRRVLICVFFLSLSHIFWYYNILNFNYCQNLSIQDVLTRSNEFNFWSFPNSTKKVDRVHHRRPNPKKQIKNFLWKNTFFVFFYIFIVYIELKYYWVLLPALITDMAHNDWK